MRNIYIFRCLVAGVFILLTALANAQCAAGETELVLTIHTDDWGYEAYWQITPQGNDCDEGTIAEGGNLGQVGCNGGGDQDATNAQGYDNMANVEEGPFCLTIGETYTLHYVDDYGDGGASFDLNLFGFPLLNYTGDGAGGTYDFTVTEPLPYDVMGKSVRTYSYLQPGDNAIKGKFFNHASEVIEDLEISYQIDGGEIVSAPVSGLNIQPFTSFEVTSPALWNTTSNGEYDLVMWISMINGNADLDLSNDDLSRMITIGPATPNILDDYLGFVPAVEQIAGSGQSILNPRDLDFHPVLTRNELWVVLKSTETSGGKTVKISNAGEGGQTSLLQQDGNAWHFMSLPTGLAFSRNENFATSPGVYDSNHDGGAPFTGPALWSSDPDIYAQDSGGNGSHLDMLHESPYSMGIAAEVDNKFWVTCGEHDEVMSYDFEEDHGPGNSDHSDGIIYKYPIPDYDEDASHEVPDHLIFDQNTGWLYVCNSQQNRIIRINTLTGTPGANATPHEATAVYKYMDDFEWEEYITMGLDEPTGIDIVEDRMIVSNYNTGDINLYDISGPSAILLGVIPTGNNGIMGVKIGPDGLIWYVNSVTDKVMRVTMQPVSVEELASGFSFNLAPNPANDFLNVSYSRIHSLVNAELRIVDMSGRLMHSEFLGNAASRRLDISSLASGVYSVVILENSTVVGARKLVID